MSVRTVAVIQARMRSTRLPGKILLELAGHPLIWHVVTRAKRIVGVDQVLIAFGGNPADPDDASIAHRIARYCGVGVYIGDEFDVLARYYETAALAGAAAVVRLTSDDPLLDSAIASGVVARFAEGDVDYCSNVGDPDPDGWDTEVISFKALERAWRDATEQRDREHVTTYVRAHPDQFRIATVPIPPERRGEPRLSVNTLEDLVLVRDIYRQRTVV